jgi:DNA-binding response OmpR family regulator
MMNRVLRILILEDRASDKDLMEFELQEAGIDFTSKWVKTEKEYVQALDDYSPDIILSDYDLPQYDGALALVEARKRCAEVPFVLVTGFLNDDRERVDGILLGGAKDCVLKDHLDRLAATVKRCLGINGGAQLQSQ